MTDCAEHVEVANACTKTLAKDLKPKQYERGIVMGATTFRALAICSYLSDGDVPEFHNNLFRAARLRLHFLVRASSIDGFSASIEAASYDDQLFDAFACQSRRTAELIIDYHRAHYQDTLDDLDRTLYSFFLRSLIAPKYPQAGTLDIPGWLRSRPSGARHALAIALDKRDAKGFEKAIKALTAERRKEIKDNELVGEGGDRVHVEGLGALWLAHQIGMKPSVKDALLPPELQATRKTKLTLGTVPSLTDREIRELDSAIMKDGGFTLKEAQQKRPDPRELG